MAKRTPVVEEYDPLDQKLAQAVFKGAEIRKSETVLTTVAATPAPRTSADMETERRCREKRLPLSRNEERQIERLVARMAEQMDTSVKLSHVLRAAVGVLLHAEEQLIRRIESSGRLTRPSNGNRTSLAQFERELTKIVSQALRDAPPLR